MKRQTQNHSILSNTSRRRVFRQRLRGVESLEPRMLMAVSIGDYVWNDLNFDGIQNESPSEGVNGVTVSLFTNAGTQVGLSTQTANDSIANPGYYSFNDVAPGDYYVVFARPTGKAFTKQFEGADQDKDSNVAKDGRSNTFSLGSGVPNISIDAGLVPTASVGTFVWWDEDSNGLQTDTEGGIVGATVSLFENGVQVATTTTNEFGQYVFEDLAPGTYTIQFDRPQGFEIASPADVPSSVPSRNDVDDSDGLGSTLITAPFTLAPGEVNRDVDQGFSKPGKVGNYVWRDVNNNGIQDEAASFGINGIAVTLFTEAGTQIGVPVVTANNSSGNPGYYLFDKLTPGRYYVRFTAPAGQLFTTPAVGSTATDSNADDLGQTATFNVLAGIEELSIDAGLRPIDLSLTSSVTDTTPAVNATVTYSVTVSNPIGFSTATGVTVTDVLPTGLTYVSDNAGGNYNSTTRSWNVGTVAPGGSVLLQVVATVASGGTKTNLVQIQTADQPDFNSTPGNAPAVREDDDATVTLTPSAKIGNYVWRDENGDGIQNEPASFGINGVTVTLFTNAGMQVGSPVITSDDGSGNPGYYLFSDINPGSYFVTVSAAADLTITTQFAGAATPATDSNVDATGKSNAFTLASGVDDVTIDAGFTKSQVCVAFDFNGNTSTSGTLGNIREFTSGPISVKASGFSRDKKTGDWANAYLGSYGGGLGVTDSSEGNGGNDTHTVDNLGGHDNYILFAFSQAVVIDSAFLGYVVEDSDLTVWVGTVPNAFNNHQLLSDTLLAGLYMESNLTTSTAARLADLNASGILGNFIVIAADVNDTSPEDRFKLQQLSLCTPGAQQPASIGNYVWHDLNGNGIQESGEPGIEGAMVTLTGGGVDGVINDVGDTIVSTTTSSTGDYSFTNLIPGTQYRVSFAVPSGFTAASPRKQGTDVSLDSDGSTSHIVILGSGQINNSIDAGFYKDIKVGNFVWNDLDSDGIQDTTEVGIGGVVMSLIGTSGSGAAINLSTSTATDGSYTFSLSPGTYQVSVSASNFVLGGSLFGYSDSPKLVGSDRGLDSNANPSATSPATLVSGSTDLTVDFGYSVDTTKVCVNLYLEGNDSTSGTAGNIRTFTSGSISARASGFSRDSAGNWLPAYLGRYGGGLGVTDSSEGDGSNGTHTVDNIGRNNYVLFEFSQGVTVDTSFLGYVVGDSDIKVWIGNAENAFNSHYTLSDQFLTGLGFSEVNFGSSGTRTADFNASNLTGNILVIAANTGESTPNDRFKIAELKLCAMVPTAHSGTKFFSVDGDSKRTYKYGSIGNFTEDFSVAASKPRGITSNVSGSNVWIADSDGKIYNYTSAGTLVSQWNSKMKYLQGITTNGTHIWTVSDFKDRVYYYPNGTTYQNGSSVNPASSFALNAYNKNPTDLTTDGTFIWVVNEGNLAGGVGDMVFKYTLSGTCLGRWQLDAANSRPTGITVNPAGGNKIWIVDNSTDRIYEYSGATGAVSGKLRASTSYALASGNRNPQGIADPVGPSDEAIARESSLAVNEQYIDPEVNPYFNTFDATDVNSDGVTSPLDALLVINRLNAARQGQSLKSDAWIYDDVSNDGALSPLDALLVINQLISGRQEALLPESGQGNEELETGSNDPDLPELVGEGEGFAGTDAYFADFNEQFHSFADGSEREDRANRSFRSLKRNYRQI